MCQNINMGHDEKRHYWQAELLAKALVRGKRVFSEELEALNVDVFCNLTEILENKGWLLVYHFDGYTIEEL